jgi:malto-oligosyltrehalose trehalohydrolase
MPFGAELGAGGNTRFRLWAPSARSVELVLDRLSIPMPEVSEGWREITASASAGTHYRFRVDGKLEVPDPASRHNPQDVHGPSEVIDPRAYEWRDEGWRGRTWADAVLYELHVGTFSPDGTFAGVERRLDYLAQLGVTALELMPIADFPGVRNWGYDGVLQFAPDASYGRPDDLKRLIDAAHARELMVLLDVVYNHFGPEGNYLHAYAAPFFSEQHHTAWGAAINFDGPGSRAVRDFFINNALYWLEEFHLDGLRFDAVHAIVDDSPLHILDELADVVRRGPGESRHIHLVLENDRNEARRLDYVGDRPLRYTAQWNDDEHHAFHVLITGERDGYYADYATHTARHLGRCLAEGFAYQGEVSPFREGAARGEPSYGLPPAAFVTFLQNHDQIGNRAFGERLPALASAARLRAATVAWLLAPSPPMLFMGEEFAAASPFLFFCDFGPELARAVTEGRRKEFAAFGRFNDASIPDPGHPETFERSKLDWLSVDAAAHADWLALYRKLLRLRRERIVPHLGGMRGSSGRHAVLGDGALLVAWQLADGHELTLVLNLSGEAVKTPDRPVGELLHCEPDSAAAVLKTGGIPPESSAVYLASSSGRR